MRYIVGILLIVVLVIFGVIFFTNGGKNAPKGHVTAPKILPDYANTDAQVQLTINGSINADQLHRSIVVNVSRTTNNFEIIPGIPESMLSK